MNTSMTGSSVAMAGAGAGAAAPAPLRLPDTYAGHPVIALRFTEGPRAGKWCRVFYGKAGNPMVSLGCDDFRAVLNVGLRSKSEARRAVRTLRKIQTVGGYEIDKAEKLEVLQRFRRVDGPGFEWVPV